MKIIGTDGNDSLIGTAKRDVIKGLKGDDAIKGLAGNDLLLGGAGDDKIKAGKGDDTVSGGAGTDKLNKNFSSETTAVNFSYTDPNSGSIQGIESVRLSTGSGDDIIVVTAASGSKKNRYFDNYIFSNDGNDSITTGAGTDYIDAGTGNDTVIGGDGYDLLVKDTSDQTTAVNFSYTNPNSGNIQGIESVYLKTGSGDDTIVSTAAIGISYGNYIFSNDGNDSITTGAGNDRIYAGAGDDYIDAGAGDDYIYGRASGTGNDRIYVGAGDDYIDAGKGNDTLYGDNGNDTLTGGAGQDRFVFNAPTEGIDLIDDFTVIDDTIAVSKAGFGGKLKAGSAITEAQFIIGSAATTATQRFIYDSASGALLFDADGVKGTAAIQFATLDPRLALTNADILVTL